MRGFPLSFAGVVFTESKSLSNQQHRHRDAVVLGDRCFTAPVSRETSNENRIKIKKGNPMEAILSSPWFAVITGLILGLGCMHSLWTARSPSNETDVTEIFCGTAGLTATLQSDKKTWLLSSAFFRLTMIRENALEMLVLPEFPAGKLFSRTLLHLFVFETKRSKNKEFISPPGWSYACAPSPKTSCRANLGREVIESL